MTIVDSASMIEDRLSLMKSLETSGSSQNPMMPRIPFSEASLNAALTSLAVTCAFTSHTKSTSETVGVGTRTDRPFNLPCKSGITSPIAFAAPVEVGIILRVAARALRRSG